MPRVINVLRIVLLAAALALAAAPAVAAIFGPDDRKPVPKRLTKTAAAVGILRAPGRGSSNECNATCVAPRVIATSAHCLYFPVRNGSRPRIQAITFRNANGESAIAGAGRGESEWNVIAGATYEAEKNSWIVSRDWALARLAGPVCEGAALELAPKNKWGDLFDAVLNDEVFVVSNNRYGRKLRQQYAAPCDAGQYTLAQALRWLAIDMGSSDPKHLIPHRCDFKRGASGSPLLLERDGKAAVVGINAAESDRQELRNQLGQEIARQISANFAVSVTAFERQIALLEGAIDPLPVEAVAALQKALRTLGHYRGRPDGRYGRRTRQATLDFERAHDLLPTGRPTTALLRSARAAAAAPAKARREIVAHFSTAEPEAPDVLAVHPETGTLARVAIDDPAKPGAAIEAALAACANEAGGECAPFAIGGEIVMGSDQESLERALAAVRRTAP